MEQLVRQTARLELWSETVAALEAIQLRIEKLTGWPNFEKEGGQ